MTDLDLDRIEATAKERVRLLMWTGCNPRDVLALVARVRKLEAELAAWKPERVECPFCGAHYYHRASEPCPQCNQFLPED